MEALDLDINNYELEDILSLFKLSTNSIKDNSCLSSNYFVYFFHSTNIL